MPLRSLAVAGFLAAGLALTGCTGDGGKPSTGTSATPKPNTEGTGASKAPTPGLLELRRNDNNVPSVTNGQKRTCANGYDKVVLPTTSNSAEFKGTEIKVTLAPEQSYIVLLDERATKPAAVVINGYAAAEIPQNGHWFTMSLGEFADESNKKVFSAELCYPKKP